MKMTGKKQKYMLHSHIRELKVHQIFPIDFSGARSLPGTFRVSEQ